MHAALRAAVCTNKKFMFRKRDAPFPVREFAEVDLATGRSNLTGGTDEGGQPKRVQGLILPKAASKNDDGGASQEGE